jgi:hypothetical protein
MESLLEKSNKILLLTSAKIFNEEVEKLINMLKDKKTKNIDILNKCKEIKNLINNIKTIDKNDKFNVILTLTKIYKKENVTFETSVKKDRQIPFSFYNTFTDFKVRDNKKKLADDLIKNFKKSINLELYVKDMIYIGNVCTHIINNIEHSFSEAVSKSSVTKSLSKKLGGLKLKK